MLEPLLESTSARNVSLVLERTTRCKGKLNALGWLMAGTCRIVSVICGRRWVVTQHCWSRVAQCGINRNSICLGNAYTISVITPT